jgi:hypothetical protein
MRAPKGYLFAKLSRAVHMGINDVVRRDRRIEAKPADWAGWSKRSK